MQALNPRPSVYKTVLYQRAPGPTRWPPHLGQSTPKVQPSAARDLAGQADRVKCARLGLRERAHAGGGHQRVGLVVVGLEAQPRGGLPRPSSARSSSARLRSLTPAEAGTAQIDAGVDLDDRAAVRAAGPSARSRPCRRCGGAGACPRSSPWRPAPRRSRHRRWRSCARPARSAAHRTGGSARNRPSRRRQCRNRNAAGERSRGSSPRPGLRRSHLHFDIGPELARGLRHAGFADEIFAAFDQRRREAEIEPEQGRLLRRAPKEPASTSSRDQT